MAETIKAKNRETKKGVVKQLRKTGGVPAVLYGHETKNMHLALDAKEFGLIYKTAGESTVLKLAVEGEKTARNVLIHDVAFDPVSNAAEHVDLYEVRMDEKITVRVPLVFEGEAPAVKTGGGVLVKNIYDIEVEALPGNLPHEIKVDISKLATFEDVLTVADLSLSAAVKVNADPGEVLATVMPPRAEAELEALKEEVILKVDEVKVESEEKKKEREEKKSEEAAE